VLKRIIPLTLVGLLLIAFTVVPALALLQTGQQAPDFQLTDLSNNAHKLSGYRGKVVVIDFFTPYCGYCQDDAKNNLIPLYNSYYKNNPNVQFLSIDADSSTAATIQSVYLQATGSIPWPILTNGVNLQTTYNFNGVPTVYVIDPVGKIAFAMQYPIDVQTLKSTIDKFAVSGQPTQLSLSADNQAPTVGSPVTFTATLKSGTTPLSSRSVTIYHYFNGVCYDDVTTSTSSTSQITLTQSYSATGQRTYYATFAGDSVNPTSTSGVTTINVGGSSSQATTTTLSASPTTTPTVGSPVTFTATLTSGTTALSGQSVTIYHYFNGVKYSDTTETTTNGQITLTQSFSSPGQRTYYATFAGDSTLQTSTSGVTTINVNAQTRVILTAPTTTPTVGQSVTFTATLSWLNPTTNQWTSVSGKSVTIYHNFNGVKYTDTTKTTDSNGQITLTQSYSSTGQRTYYATFAGDSWYNVSTSSAMTLNVR
jgi:thiol-disulfide isomerase/thioredoxin